MNSSFTGDSTTIAPYDNTIYYPEPVWPNPNPFYYTIWPTPNTTTICIGGESEPVFSKVGGTYKLKIDAPGFGKEEDTLDIYVKGDTLEVHRNLGRSIYIIPEQLDRDTLSAKVEFGQIIVTADVKEQHERKSIPIEFRR